MNNRETKCAVTGNPLNGPSKTIVITRTPSDVDGGADLLHKKVGLGIYLSQLRKAGFRGYNLDTAQQRRFKEAKANVSRLLAARNTP